MGAYTSTIVSMISYLAKLSNKEMTTTELLSIVNNGYNQSYSIDELFEIHDLFKKKAMERGYVLDSMKFDNSVAYRLPFDIPWVCRAMPR